MAKTLLKNNRILKLLKVFLILNGLFFLMLVVLAFTTLPYWGYHWLGTSKTGLSQKPETIILLGGSGMPSQSNLMRSWFVSLAAAGFPEAKILIAMPGELADSLSTPQKMKAELELHGVGAKRFIFENQGTNTRSQALNCAKKISSGTPVLLVTSPEHTRRAVLSFRKAGFKNVGALPAFENAAEADFSFDDDKLGGNKLLVPDVGNNTQVRYQVWTHLQYEILFLREMSALAYYWLCGWI